jgi:three-Cys-motif partner protein
VADDRCQLGGRKKTNGNCTKRGEDGHAFQCVGPWAEEKHDYLARYIEATRAVRAKFLEPLGSGGAAFLDLFAGPGRACVRDSGRKINGTPLIALEHSDALFSKVILCELDDENVSALRARTARFGDRAVVVPGDNRQTIDEALKHVPRHGLNFALLDPFAVSALDFGVIRKLAAFQRMDLLIHFPTGDIRRNFDMGAREKVAKAMGRESAVANPSDVPKMIEEFRQGLAELGYTGNQVYSVPVRHNGTLLYQLMFASKSERGDKIWNSIASTLATGQRLLFRN